MGRNYNSKTIDPSADVMEVNGRPLSKMAFFTLDEMFRQTAQTHGPQPALITQHGSSLSYTQLDSLTTTLAAKLTNLCFGKSQTDKDRGVSPVLLAMAPGTERIISILAIWKMKNAYYVPIEPCIPKNRIKLIVREIKPSLILTCDVMVSQLSHVDIYAEGVNLMMTYNDLMNNSTDDAYKGDEKKSASGEVEKEAFSSDAEACVLYTSGSTGTPKGVVLTHRNILSRLAWQWDQFPFDANAVGIAKTSLLFVDSITEIWSFVLKGKPIVVMNEKLRDVEVLVKTMNDFNVSRIVLVPSLLQSILYYCKMTSISLPKLHEVVCSGERLPIETAHNFFNVFDDKTLLNFYGSTEITGDATFAVFRNVDELNEQIVDGNVPIGIPIDGVRIKLVTEQDETESENSLTGQIVVEGPTVMKRYFNSSANSTEYYTGDFGRIQEGRLYFEGRKDDQVKIRGNRVNCREIQQMLCKALNVNVVVMTMNADPSQAEIVAFLEGDADMKAKATEICQQTLPGYMNPSAIHAMDKLPLTKTNQKIDRQMLIVLHKHSRLATGENTLDDQVRGFLKIISDEVGIDQSSIRLEDEFVTLGGNSVNKVRLASILTDKGHDFAFGHFMAAKTLNAMYEVMHSGKDSPTSSTGRFEIVQYQPNDSAPPEHIRDLLFDSFANKDSFTILAGIDIVAAQKFTDFIYQTSVANNALFLIKERSSGEYVGSFSGLESGPFNTEGLPASVQLMLEVISQGDEAFDPVPEGEKIMEYFTLTTSRKMNPEENLELVKLAEEYMIQVCRDRGYYAVTATNTNYVTQSIAEQLGYVEKGSFFLKDYTRPDGTKPFARAPPDFMVKSQIKILKDL